MSITTPTDHLITPWPTCLPSCYVEHPNPHQLFLLSLRALRAIIGSVSSDWLMFYKSSPGLANPPTALQIHTFPSMSPHHVLYTLRAFAPNWLLCWHPGWTQRREQGSAGKQDSREALGERIAVTGPNHYQEQSLRLYRWVTVGMQIHQEKANSVFVNRAVATTNDT